MTVEDVGFTHKEIRDSLFLKSRYVICCRADMSKVRPRRPNEGPCAILFPSTTPLRNVSLKVWPSLFSVNRYKCLVFTFIYLFIHIFELLGI